ncbi:MAG: N-acetylmuramoyl-L-alanine amidase [Clostridiales bacterium]|nr:N-acetylmuramoyl-L-alanine amidase [Eubacteriales bacterium]MDH7566578.1 N-acetylmuramoyl-L-alanine amidase [Clostridiales bacterium]
MKRIFTFMVLLFVLTANCLPVFAQSSSDIYSASHASVFIDGEKLDLLTSPVIKNNRLLVPLRSLFEAFGADIEWRPETRAVKVAKDSIAIDLVIGNKTVTVNGSSQDLDVEPILVNDRTMVPLRFIAETIGFSILWNPSSASAFLSSGDQGSGPSGGGGSDNPVVVVDAGHGGSDPGEVSGGVYEKNLNLDVAKRLNKLLTDAGIKTYMTRTDDSYVDLYDRSDLANSVNADLFISIHHNARGDTYTAGTMTLYYPERIKGDLTSQNLAQIVQQNLLGKLGTNDLGIIPRPNLAVLRTTNMPAIIAELGYMTNKNELARIQTESFKQKSAEALRDAVLIALKKMG